MNTRRYPPGSIISGRVLAIVVITALGSGAMSTEASADAWAMRVAPQTMLASYSGSELRDSLFNVGVFLSGDYLEQAGFALGYNYNKVNGKDSNADSFNAIEENAFYLSGKLHRYPDSLPGKLTLRLDAYALQDKTSSNNHSSNPGAPNRIGSSTTTIGVANPIVGFINHARTYALDLGYAFSNYDGDNIGEHIGDTGEIGASFQVHQLTPTWSLALGGSANWLQLRGYFIFLSDDSIAAGESNSAALEAKFTHWFGPRAPLRLYAIGMNIMAGKRFLAVDPDAAAVFSLADQQQGSIALHSTWKPAPQTSLTLQIGYEQYEDLRLSNDYNSRYIYFNLSQQW